MMPTFKQFVGNERTVAAVKAMLAENRVPHTLVIEGPPGSGRKTLANILAAGLMCESADSRPCGACSACRQVARGHPDIAVVRPTEGKAAVSVEQIRTVRSEAFVLPGQGKCKIFIIEGPFNEAAQNAFLKVLEEPPAHVYFVLICGHRSELMDTVLSRSVILSVGTVSFEEAIPVLEAAGQPVNEAARQRFIQSGNVIGAVLTEDTYRKTAAAIGEACMKTVADGQKQDFLRAVVPAMQDRLLYGPVLAIMYQFIQTALTLQVGGQTSFGGETALLLARRLTTGRLLYLADIIEEEQKKLPYHPNGGLFFTTLCAELFLPKEK